MFLVSTATTSNAHSVHLFSKKQHAILLCSEYIYADLDRREFTTCDDWSSLIPCKIRLVSLFESSLWPCIIGPYSWKYSHPARCIVAAQCGFVKREHPYPYLGCSPFSSFSHRSKAYVDGSCAKCDRRTAKLIAFYLWPPFDDVQSWSNTKLLRPKADIVRLIAWHAPIISGLRRCTYPGQPANPSTRLQLHRLFQTGRAYNIWCD